MQNRGDRLYRKAQIKKRLIEKAILHHNRRRYNQPVRDINTLLVDSYQSLRSILRNEGKHRSRIYKCGESGCDWCIGNLTRQRRRYDAKAKADRTAWENGEDTLAIDDTLWERKTKWRRAVREVLDLLSRFDE